jgi:hypothetical protein
MVSYACVAPRRRPGRAGPGKVSPPGRWPEPRPRRLRRADGVSESYSPRPDDSHCGQADSSPYYSRTIEVSCADTWANPAASWTRRITKSPGEALMSRTPTTSPTSPSGGAGDEPAGCPRPSSHAVLSIEPRPERAGSCGRLLDRGGPARWLASTWRRTACPTAGFGDRVASAFRPEAPGAAHTPVALRIQRCDRRARPRCRARRSVLTGGCSRRSVPAYQESQECTMGGGHDRR